MVLPAVKQQILDDLEQLSPELQQQAAERVRALVAIPRGASLSQLQAISGTLDKESADQMRRAIEDGCGHIDNDGW